MRPWQVEQRSPLGKHEYKVPGSMAEHM